MVYFSKAIIQETMREARLCYVERDSYRQLFEALQEGIIVVQDDQITFMNQLANRILTSLTPYKNFLLAQLEDDFVEDEMINRLERKMFYVVQNLDNKKQQKSSSSNHNTSASESKVEYSINDLIAAADKDLFGKIFTMDKALTGQKMDDLVGKDFNFKN